MQPNTNSDAEINVYCDWLTDNGQDQLATDTRFDESLANTWYPETKTSLGDGPGYQFGAVGGVGTTLNFFEMCRGGRNVGQDSANINDVGGSFHYYDEHYFVNPLDGRVTIVSSR